MELASGLGVRVVFVCFPVEGLKGMCFNGIIALSSSLCSDNDKAAILAEELGHVLTAVGDILDLSLVNNKKLEMRGRRWAYEYLVPAAKLKNAIASGCCYAYELAEALDVPEAFLVEAVDYYKKVGKL